jgi:hypothetical protein
VKRELSLRFDRLRRGDVGGAVEAKSRGCERGLLVVGQWSGTGKHTDSNKCMHETHYLFPPQAMLAITWGGKRSYK